jgi:hypothetical protein
MGLGIVRQRGEAEKYAVVGMTLDCDYNSHHHLDPKFYNPPRFTVNKEIHNS